jgi:predicted PurR-regulated permease PerM
MAFQTLKVAVGGYFKAQFQIMAVLTTILLVGFLILDIKYMIILAIAIAFLDFLPFFGTAVTLLPWAVYEVINKDYKVAIGLVILYVVTQLTRQLIQPKLVGDSVGLKPLPTLFFLYIGYKLGSVLGMILAVPVGMIIINMFSAGAFDYILDDAKILIKGIEELRK